MTLQHRSRPGQAGIAPYNFVPLPGRVMPHPEGWDAVRSLNDRYHPDRHTGWLDLTIRTETPLYTRCAHLPGGGSRADFFHHGDAGRVPVLPGSSIRGPVRALVEILSHGKMAGTMDRKLFYRFMGGSLRTLYTDRFVERQDVAGPQGNYRGYRPAVRAGRFHRSGSGGWIEPCEFARVHHNHLPTPLHAGAGRGDTPNPALQHAEVWVDLEPSARWHLHDAPGHDPMYLWYRRVGAPVSTTPVSGYARGQLVITGPVRYKRMEFVFLPGSGRIDVDPEKVREFEHSDQITGWQEDAFPAGAGRPGAGMLRDGDPVFFLPDPSGSGVLGFGRAQMFRFPYEHKTSEFVPASLQRKDVLDLAEGMFGTVGDAPDRTVRGRISFEDARCVTPSPFLDEDGRRVPQVLSAPKPTSFQHYLVQPGGPAEDFRHYSSEPETETIVRGHKLYWHKNGVADAAIWMDGQLALPHPGQPDSVQERRTVQEAWQVKPGKSQYTVVRPVRRGVEFRGRIHFENLSDLELGALLTAVQLPGHMRHKLGMGKPLGMGSVRLEARLYLSDRHARYTDFFSAAERSETEVAGVEARARKRFEEVIIEHAGCHTVDSLWKIPRLEALDLLLGWDRAPDHVHTRYVAIEGNAFQTNGGQWQSRSKVLPTPQWICTGKDPDLRSHTASPAGAGPTAMALALAQARGAGLEESANTGEPSADAGSPVKFRVSQRVRAELVHAGAGSTEFKLVEGGMRFRVSRRVVGLRPGTFCTLSITAVNRAGTKILDATID